ncbi:MAG: YceI family protein [Actinomycetota bacterium]
MITEIKNWSAKATIAENPAESTFTATADMSSFSVVEGVGGVKPLSEGDKADIKKNATQKVVTKHDITFESSAVQPQGDNAATVSGDLQLMGKKNPVQIKLSESNGKVTAKFTVVQSKWGIKPFSAMMGALKVKDEIPVEIEATLPE